MGRRLGLAGKSSLAGIVGVTFCILAACGSDDDVGAAPGRTPAGGSDGSSAETATPTTTDGGATVTDAQADARPADAGPFAIVSASYVAGAEMPAAQKCPNDSAGSNVSPQLTWSGAPAGTMSYAIVMRDIDFTPAEAPNGFRHWVIWDIPASTSLGAGVPAGYEPTTPAGAKQAIPQAPSGGTHRYVGPCSPGRLNTYVITIYAIPTATIPGLGMSSTAAAAETAIVGAAIGSAAIAGEG